MNITTFIVSVFCLVDDWLQGQRLRERGPAPTLRDSQVLTMEIVGKFLGIDTDKGLYLHFRRHYSDWFPGLRQISRTTFVRQAANLWITKYRLWQAVLKTSASIQPYRWLIDIRCPSVALREPIAPIFASYASGMQYDTAGRSTLCNLGNGKRTTFDYYQ